MRRDSISPGLGLACLAFVSMACGGGQPSAHEAEQRDGLVDNLPTLPTDPAAGLGRGRDLVTEELRDWCLGGDAKLDTGSAYSHAYLDSTMTQAKLTETLDVSGGVDGKFWGITASEEASFNRSVIENDWSIVVAYGIDMKIGTRYLDPNTRRLLVDPASTPNWFARCGDHALTQTDVGGKLVVAARIEFDSRETKTKFANKLSAGFSWGSVKSTLELNRQTFQGKAVIRIEAWQKGGDVVGVGHVLVAPGIVECGIGDMSKCDGTISSVLAYAGSATFQSGMNAKPADTRYLWQSWRTLLSNPPPERSVPAQVVPARDALKQRLKDQLAVADRLTLVEASVNAGHIVATAKFRADLPGLKNLSARNLQVLRAAAAECFDNLDDPTNAGQLNLCLVEASPERLAQRGYDGTLTLERIDPNAGYVPPPLPGVRVTWCDPGHLVLGNDYNGDGRADLSCHSDSPYNGHIVALANGDGTFTRKPWWTNGALYGWCDRAHLRFHDFDGDGKMDLGCHSDDGLQHVALSNGDGTFAAKASWGPWCDFAHLRFGDFNGDGKSDLSCHAANGVHYVALSNGNGTFAAQQAWGGWCDPGHLRLADFDGDRKTDLSCHADNGVHYIALSQGNGRFAAQPAWGGWCDPGHLVLNDYNGDGRTDLSCHSDYPTRSHIVAFSNGNGTFTPKTWWSAGNQYGWCDRAHLRFGDFNGDGRTDLSCHGDTGIHNLALSNGDGTFTAKPSWGGWCDPGHLRLADYNDDRKLDLSCHPDDGGHIVAFSNGDGTFRTPGWWAE